jgi:hypothetical protein
MEEVILKTDEKDVFTIEEMEERLDAASVSVKTAAVDVEASK